MSPKQVNLQSNPKTPARKLAAIQPHVAFSLFSESSLPEARYKGKQLQDTDNTHSM